jgi:hypothetical protein
MASNVLRVARSPDHRESHLRIATASILVLSLAAGPAAATTGDEMLPHCRKAVARAIQPDNSAYDAGFCTGVVATVLSLNSVLDRQYRFCPPAGATTEQAIKVVITGLEARPDTRKRDFRLLAFAALNQAWPCR